MDQLAEFRDQYLRSGLQHPEINHVRIKVDRGCSSCLALNNKIVSLREAIETQPLPNPDCRGDSGNGTEDVYCALWYEHVFDDEL